ncbi:MAG: hypothetical protein WD397_09860 [Wenzhouxiangellaceae bacterium]
MTAGLLLAVIFSTAVFAGSGLWTSSGPEGGQVSGLAASPDVAGTFWAVSRGGIFKTVDGGVTWTEANAGINRQLNGIIFHSPSTPGRLYAFGSNKMFFTSDGGASWNDRSPPSTLLTGTIWSADLSRTTPGRVYVGLSDGAVLRSDDAGLTWTATTPIPQAGAFLAGAIASHPTTAGELLVATDAGDRKLWRGSAGGSAWVEIPCPAGCPWENFPLRDIEFAGTGGTVWAVTAQGAARSDDFGATWTDGGALPSGGGQRISVHPSDSAEVYLAGRSGLAYTTDNGTSWTEVLGGFSGNSLLHPAESTVVVHDPFNPALQLAGSSSNGVYRRTATSLDSFSPGVDGFNATNIRALDTTLGDRVHAAIGDAFSATFASFRSTNNGASWSQANGGLEADHFRDISVDPNDISVVYAGGLSIPKLDNTGTLVAGNGGIYKSTDGGVTWTTIDNGIPAPSSPFGFSPFGTVRSVLVDEFSSAGGASQILFAGGSGRFNSDGSGGFTKEAARIYKSIDAGANWTASDTGIGGAEAGVGGNTLFASVVQLVQDHSDPTGNSFYAATFIGGLQDTDAPSSIDNGVFRTIDGGANWTHVSNGLPHINGNPAATNESVLSLAIDPTDITGQTLYASTNDIANNIVGTVYKTIDGGANWLFSGTGLVGRDVRDLIVDPNTGDVYAAVADPLSNGDGGVFVSQDGGASWNSVSTGFPNSAVATKLALDNTGTNLIVQAGTTRGVQSFEVLPDEDTDGATDATESQAPNSGDGNDDGSADAGQADVASTGVAGISVNGIAQRGVQNIVTATLTPIDGSCDQLENSFGLNLLHSVPEEDSFEMPFNGLHVRIPDCQQAELTIIYHGSVFDDVSYQVRGYGLDFPDQDIATWHRLPATGTDSSWSVVLTDGELGDATPEDGVIVFQGGAKRLAERFFSDGMEAE